ncbi:unnamed protein product [Brachionus calyciflorus]|uniref:Uncharacterized protein n=1 Tax=Brachionus calyciflorus TaxID=104777 RepID=A0A814KMW1_9BILA|nr:unnamed protein product [Brachionus calyciflorus]
MRGVNRKFLQSYLDEFTYRHNLNLTRNGTFEAILKCIGKLSNFDRPHSVCDSNDQLEQVKNFGLDDLEDRFEDNVSEDVVIDLFPDGDLVDFVYNGVSTERNNVELKFLDLTELSFFDFKQAIDGIIYDLKSNIYIFYDLEAI